MRSAIRPCTRLGLERIHVVGPEAATLNRSLVQRVLGSLQDTMNRSHPDAANPVAMDPPMEAAAAAAAAAAH